MGVAIVTGASRGLGQALAEGLAQEGWSLIIDGRDPVALAAAAARLEARPRRHGGRGGRRHHRCRPPAGPGHGGCRGWGPRPPGQQRRHSGGFPPPPGGRLPARCAAGGPRGQRRGPARPDPGRPTPPPRRAAAPPAHHHLGRGRGGLRGLGRRSNSSAPCSPSSCRRCRCGRSTPATSARTCSKRRTRVRTSRTGPSRQRWYPPSSGSSTAIDRAGAIEPPTCGNRRRTARR